MFNVEVHYRLACARCGHQIKRRFLDYLSSRTTSCPNCNVKMVHLARGQSGKSNVDMDEIRRVVEQLEGDWSSLVNEWLTSESNAWGAEELGLA